MAGLASATLPLVLSVRQGAKPMQSAPTYNVFARRRSPALCCAIAQESPVPSFIDNETWEFGGTLKPLEVIPGGFQPKAAREATQILGYYLFHSWASH
jgi:hypothetical protein